MCVYLYLSQSATRLLTLFALQTFPRWKRRESESLNPLRARNSQKEFTRVKGHTRAMEN